ncbi:MAG: flagellar filament capping protein FliD [Burkholderiales bacterium]|nr:flagellar filament capping protein FliD [Burkholderiales bacterium]MBK9347254.1 flagellar filament capping protein FliD [Burkholderiales bacterium]
MAISSPGVGSGLDVNSIVTQLVAIEKQPLQALQTKATSLQSQLSLYGTIKSQVSALKDAATTLASTTGWALQAATSSNTAAATVSVDSTATSTLFGLDITRLAQSQTTASRSVTANASLGAGAGTGQLSIQLGSWGAAGAGPFVPGAAAAVTVNVNESDTYTTIASAINAANAGVKATVLKVGTTERLLFQSSTSGSDAGFSIASNSGFAALDSLSFTSLANGSESALGMESSQVGLNAQLKINNVAVESATNTVSNMVPGVTLNLAQTTAVGSPVQITVAQDKVALQKNIQTFADAYSALSKTLADSTKYVQGGKSGALQGDSTTVGLQSLMRKIIGSSSTGSTYARLSEVGLEQQTDGSLKLNTTKLATAMGDTSNLQKLFTTNNSDTATNGFGLKLRDLATGLLASDGTVGNKSTALQGAISRNGKEQDRVNERAAVVEKRLRAQYSALDAQMAQLTGLSSYVTAQLAQWNKTS